MDSRRWEAYTAYSLELDITVSSFSTFCRFCCFLSRFVKLERMHLMVKIFKYCNFISWLWGCLESVFHLVIIAISTTIQTHKVHYHWFNQFKMVAAKSFHNVKCVQSALVLQYQYRLLSFSFNLIKLWEL